MKKTILLLIISSIYITGCASNTNKQITKKPDTEKPLVAVIDPEAAELGFPEKFISKKNDKIDWTQATAKKVDNIDVEVYDTGVTVEVCGGLNCDK